jgi:hypothetical protein
MTGINPPGNVLCDKPRLEANPCHATKRLFRLSASTALRKPGSNGSVKKGELLKGLVVEVSFDTDPNSLHFRQSVIDAIVDTAKANPKEDATVVVSRLRIVPPR